MDNQSHIIRVLLVEDNPGDVRLIQEMLKEPSYLRFKLTCAGSLGEGMKCLDEGVFDVLLLDIGLPDSQKLDTVRSINSKAHDLPIVVITGLVNEMLSIEAVREGAQDYLVKGQFDSNLLIHSMRYSIERKRMENEIKERFDEVERMNKLMIGRELKMEEMKKEIQDLKLKIQEMEKKR